MKKKAIEQEIATIKETDKEWTFLKNENKWNNWHITSHFWFPSLHSLSFSHQWHSGFKGVVSHISFEYLEEEEHFSELNINKQHNCNYQTTFRAQRTWDSIHYCCWTHFLTSEYRNWKSFKIWNFRGFKTEEIIIIKAPVLKLLLFYKQKQKNKLNKTIIKIIISSTILIIKKQMEKVCQARKVWWKSFEWVAFEKYLLKRNKRGKWIWEFFNLIGKQWPTTKIKPKGVWIKQNFQIVEKSDWIRHSWNRIITQIPEKKMPFKRYFNLLTMKSDKKALKWRKEFLLCLQMKCPFDDITLDIKQVKQFFKISQGSNLRGNWWDQICTIISDEIMTIFLFYV